MAAHLTKWALHCIHAVIAPTDKVKTVLTDYGIVSEISVVPTGIDLCKFDVTRDESKLQQLRAKFDIRVESKIVITVGR